MPPFDCRDSRDHYGHFSRILTAWTPPVVSRSGLVLRAPSACYIRLPLGLLDSHCVGLSGLVLFSPCNTSHGRENHLAHPTVMRKVFARQARRNYGACTRNYQCWLGAAFDKDGKCGSRPAGLRSDRLRSVLPSHCILQPPRTHPPNSIQY